MAYIGASGDPNNWGTRVGISGSTFYSGIQGEQPSSGINSGPTNSVLDFYLFPGSGSTTTMDKTYLGSFTLSSDGKLHYGPAAIPEPASVGLLAFGVAVVVITRRRRASV